MLTQLPDAILEERIIRHLAATAATGRTQRMIRRGEGQRNRAGSHGQQQFLVSSPHLNAPNIDSVSASSAQRGNSESTPSIVSSSQSSPLPIGNESPNDEAHSVHVQADHSPLLMSGTNSTASRATVSANRCSLVTFV